MVKSNISDNESFSSIKTLSNSNKNDLSFFSNLKYINDLKKSKAKACIIEDRHLEYLPKNSEPIIVKDTYLALALISNLFNDEYVKSNGIISKNSYVHSECKIKKNVQINPFSIIDKNTELDENVYIGSNFVLDQMLKLIKNVVILDNVSIANAIIMENCIIKSGARIGGRIWL